jgi:hypothetical protein
MNTWETKQLAFAEETASRRGQGRTVALQRLGRQLREEVALETPFQLRREGAAPVDPEHDRQRRLQHLHEGAPLRLRTHALGLVVLFERPARRRAALRASIGDVVPRHVAVAVVDPRVVARAAAAKVARLRAALHARTAGAGAAVSRGGASKGHAPVRSAAKPCSGRLSHR